MYISQTDIQNIKNMGFNAIKWWLTWGAFMPTPDPASIPEAYFTQGTNAPAGNALDSVVNWCEQAGLYIIMGSGWTQWWTPPSWTKLSGASSDGTALWTDPTTRDGFYAMMNWIAKRYGSRSHVIFEGINEITAPEGDAPAFAAFNDGWISAVEQGEGANKHLKIIQLLIKASWTYNLATPFINGNHANVMMASHDYPFVDAYLNQVEPYAQQISNAIHSQNLPWVDTEFSTAVNTSSSPPRDVGLNQAMYLFTKYGAAGWSYFCYDSNPTSEGDWNLRNPSNATAILPILQPYMNDGTTPIPGFPWWTIPVGIAIGGGYLLKKYGKKPRG